MIRYALMLLAISLMSAPASAGPQDKGPQDVNVTNDSTNPVPVDVQNTVPVQVQGTPSVNATITGTPSVNVGNVIANEAEPYQALYMSKSGGLSGTDNSVRLPISIQNISGGAGAALTGLDLISRSTASGGYCAYTIERDAADTPQFSDNKLWIHFDPSRPDTDLGRNTIHYNFIPPIAVTQDLQVQVARGGNAGICDFLLVLRGRTLTGF